MSAENQMSTGDFINTMKECSSMPRSMYQVLCFTRIMGAHEGKEVVIPELSVVDLRVKLIKEEFDELVMALTSGNLVEAVDALMDLQYVLDGTVIALGLHHKQRELFDEVQRSNMSKLDRGGKPIINDGTLRPDLPVGKVLKSDKFVPPNLEKILYDKS